MSEKDAPEQPESQPESDERVYRWRVKDEDQPVREEEKSGFTDLLTRAGGKPELQGW